MAINTFKLQVAGITKELNVTIEPDLKFIVRLERPKKYEGEFGFDWLRDDYENDCADYEALKKEYTPEKIYEEDYYVPWLAMFPEQEDVKLTLKITEKEGTVNDSEIIKFPAKDGITFEPESIKVSEANDTEVTIKCAAGVGDTVLDILDKNDKVVGKLNFYENKEVNELPIRVIKVLKLNDEKGLNEHVFDEYTANNEIFTDLKETLEKRGLNQALIKPVFDDADYASIRELKVDFTEVNTLGLADYNPEDSSYPTFKKGKKDKLRDYLVEKQDAAFGKFKGIIVFTAVIRTEGNAAGFSWVMPRDNNVVMIPNGGFKVSTYLHEIGHSIGLEHTFCETDEDKETIDKYKKNAGIYQENIDKWEKGIQGKEARIKKYKGRRGSDILTFTGGEKKTIQVYREECLAKIEEYKANKEKNQEKLDAVNQKIEDYESVANPYFFTQATTDNTMDYVKSKDGTKTNPHKHKSIFHKYQWPMMKAGVKIIT